MLLWGCYNSSDLCGVEGEKTEEASHIISGCGGDSDVSGRAPVSHNGSCIETGMEGVCRSGALNVIVYVRNRGRCSLCDGGLLTDQARIIWLPSDQMLRRAALTRC